MTEADKAKTGLTETSEASAPPEGSDHQRIARVESKVDQLISAVNKILPGSHAEAEQRTEERLDRGSTVEDQVRAELQRAKQEQEAAEKADAEKREGESLKERLARLEEKPPAPPRSRRTALLGWGDGR